VHTADAHFSSPKFLEQELWAGWQKLRFKIHVVQVKRPGGCDHRQKRRLLQSLLVHANCSTGTYVLTSVGCGNSMLLAIETFQ
jgi:hypothetical protein